jgi:hypothetical protein
MRPATKECSNAIRALLNGDGSGKDHGLLLSALFDQWRAERRPTVKTWLEFRRAMEGFTETVGDLPVQKIKKEHVALWKRALLEAQSRRGKNGGTIKVATALKLEGLEWATDAPFSAVHAACCTACPLGTHEHER